MPATQKYPWTDDQVRRAYHAAQSTTVGFDLGDIREILRGFHEHGITVEIPGERFYAVEMSYQGEGWKVVDRHDPEPAVWVARFNGPDAEKYARSHAERLNLTT